MRKPAILAAIIILAAFAAAFAFGALAPQNGHDQFQKALAKERGEGNLEEAIALYQKVIAETKDETLAAQAQFRIGICYEKLGQEKAKLAQAAFQKILDTYPNQVEIVKAAREKLTVLAIPPAPARALPGKGELIVRKICLSDSTGSPAPDGSFISIADWPKGNLAVRDLASDNTRLLTKNATGDIFVGHSVVSPDGREIAYSWYDEEWNYSLWLINVDGSGNRRLFRGEGDWHIEPSDWSPDGSRILALHTLSYPSQACQIVLVTASDGSMKVLKELGRKAPSNVCFSPDGRFIAYDYPSGESTAYDIFVMTADGGQEVPLVENPADDRLLGWTPDGRQVLFRSDRAGNSGAWLVPVQDGRAQGAPRLVKHDLGSIEPMGFTKDGTFYYGIGGWRHDVYAQDVDLEGGKLLGQPELAVKSFVGSNGMPAWSPDGEHLAYITRRTKADASSPSMALCLRSSGDGKEHALFPDLDWFQWPRWSPDSKALIVVASDRSNHLGGYIIDAVTGAVSPVLNSEKDEYNPVNLLEWSHDGRSVYFTRNDEKAQKSEIILRSLETGQERQIASLAGQNRYFMLPLLSPDGKSLAVTVMDQDQESNLLAVMPPEGGEPRELLELEKIPGPRGLTWGPDSRTILFIKSVKTGGREQPNQGRNELWLVSTETGKQRKLGELLAGRGVEISVHPNGRGLVFSKSFHQSEIWTMENILPASEGKEK
jgi:Tol biopolymer transport system component